MFDFKWIALPHVVDHTQLAEACRSKIEASIEDRILSLECHQVSSLLTPFCSLLQLLDLQPSPEFLQAYLWLSSPPSSCTDRGDRNMTRCSNRPHAQPHLAVLLWCSIWPREAGFAILIFVCSGDTELGECDSKAMCLSVSPQGHDKAEFLWIKLGRNSWSK